MREQCEMCHGNGLIFDYNGEKVPCLTCNYENGNLKNEASSCNMCKHEWAEFKYGNKVYCPNCLLKVLETEGEVESFETVVKGYSYTKGDYIGDNYEGEEDIIESLLSNIAGLKTISFED